MVEDQNHEPEQVGYLNPMPLNTPFLYEQRIKLLAEFDEKTKGMSLVKKNETRDYKYVKLQELINLCDEKLKGSDFFYRLGFCSAALYHKDHPYCLEAVVVDEHHFMLLQKEVIPHQKQIMAQEQKMMSFSTFARKRALECLFKIKTPDDPDQEIQVANEKEDLAIRQEARYNGFVRRLRELSHEELLAKEKSIVESIMGDKDITATQKNKLFELVETTARPVSVAPVNNAETEAEQEMDKEIARKIDNMKKKEREEKEESSEDEL